MLKYWRHLAAAFVACLVLVLLAQPAEAVGGQYGAFTYELKGNGTAVITKFDWSKHSGGDVYVPRSIDGYQVTTIGKFAFTSQMDEVTLDYTGDDIHEKLCGSRVAIILPDTITVIEEKAFFWTSITTCDIPASVQIIGPGAFAGCRYIRQFSVNSSNRTFAVIDGVLYNKATKELVAFPLGTSDSGCVIPNGITSIGDYAFYALNSYSYDRSKSIQLSFPESITKVGDYAFYAAELPNGYLPSGVLEIGEYAFAYAYFYTNTYLLRHRLYPVPSTAYPKVVGSYAFYYTDVVEYELNMSMAHLTSISEGAFRRCEVVPTDDFGLSSVTIIPEYAFADGRTPRVLPDTLITIGENAFRSCFVSLSIPSNVETIESYAFFGASGRVDFSNASRLKYIGDEAFSFNSKDSDIFLPDSVETLGTKAFHHYSISLLYIPASVVAIGDNVVDRTKTVLQVEPGSYADIWASENGYPMQVDDTSWLFE